MKFVSLFFLFLILLSACFCSSPSSAEGQQSGNLFSMFLPIIFLIVIIFLIYSFIKKMNKNQGNKKIIGIILASIGGIAGILFGVLLAQANNQLYFSSDQQESALTTYGILTAIGVIVFIIGIIVIVTTKNTNANSKPEDKQKSSSSLDELQKLSELKEKGVLTEDEFQEQKKKILGS